LNFKSLIIFILLFFFFAYLAAENSPNSIKNLLKKSNSFLYTNSDSTNYYINKALYLSKQNNNKDLELLCNIELTRYNIVWGHYTDAFNYCNNSKILAKSYNSSEYNFRINMYNGLIFSNMGLFADALKLLLETQKLDSANNVSLNLKSELDYYTGKTYFDIGDFNQGMKYIRSSISNAAKDNDTLGLLLCYTNITKVHNNTDTVNKYFKLCDDILESKPKMLYEKVALLVNKAMTMKDIGKLELSKNLYLEAIQLSEYGGFDEYLAIIYNNYAYQLMYEHNFDSVNYYLDKSIEVAKKINNIEAIVEVYDSYSDYYSRIGDYKNSLKYSKLYIEKSNEFRKQKKLQETRFLSAVFENEKKENAILKQQNEINKLWIYVNIAIVFLIIVIAISIYFRQRWALSKSKLETTEKTKKLEIAEAKIQGQDAERDRLGMDLHDGIVSDLSALKMRIQSYFKENDEFGTVNHSLNTIIQNLRGLSHRMRPASLEEFGLVPSIQNLVYTVNQSNKFKVDFYCDFDDRLSQNIEISIYFLIYELVNNATKYSSGDTIDIQLYKDKELINLSVEDNGGGFNPDNKNAGQGLKNIRDRLTQLGGSLVIDSHDDATAFIINIPI